MREERITAECAAFVGALTRVEVELARGNELRAKELEGLALIAERLEVCTERVTARLELIARCLGALGRE